MIPIRISIIDYRAELLKISFETEYFKPKCIYM